MVQNLPISTPGLIGTSLSRRRVIQLAASGSALGIGTLLTGHGRLAAAQATPSDDLPAYPAVTITAENADDGHGYIFGLPDSLPTGYVKVTLENRSDGDHHVMFMRPNEGVTAEEFIEKAKSTPNPGDFASMAASVGGPGSISPGQTSSVIMNLDEGPYVLICEVPGADGMPHYMMGMIDQIDVTPTGTPVTTPPTAEATVDVVDFAFEGLPSTLPAGQYVWEVVNRGPQEHELVVLSLAPGLSPEDVFAILTAPPQAPAATAEASPAAMPAGGPPVVAVTGSAPMAADYTVWPVMDLVPGSYVTVCFVADPKTGMPHLMLGMYGAFTVE